MVFEFSDLLGRLSGPRLLRDEVEGSHKPRQSWVSWGTRRLSLMEASCCLGPEQAWPEDLRSLLRSKVLAEGPDGDVPELREPLTRLCLQAC